MAVSSKHFQVPSSFTLPPSSFFSSLIPSSPISVTASTIRASTKFSSIRVRFSRRSIVRYNDHAGEDEEDSDEDKEEYWSFEEAVTLFNKRDYYKSHDALEALWIQAEEPTRTLIHGILQCAVGFHHLFNNNHKGAMMELGEGVCSEDMCLTMDQSDRSYQLLGGYAAGESIYSLETVLDFNNGMSETTSILFSPLHSSSEPTRVKLPTLTATDKHLLASTYDDRF
ncbi:unnamed protein product [Arabidopsis thaliana]|uniref:(thale cress) hypothetical protein n=1 Tax=Arabidopsis thaliana TaxID=3702 RepID=A0A7G2EDA5_ARATH|nr:unnamed protein product [Arabidopsis thaliana]